MKYEMETNSDTKADHWDNSISDAFDFGEVPNHVQARLDRTYAALKKIPQETAVPKRHRLRKGAVAMAAAAACMVFAGAAFATSNMVHMYADNSGNAAFFSDDRNLPIYNSLEPGAKSLNADVSQTATLTNSAGESFKGTLDSISCDRNVANLYFTLKKDDGFNIDAAGNYEGSDESTWAKLQNILPGFEFTLSGEDGFSTQGTAHALDAYTDGQDIKCLYRITPAYTMPSQVQLNLSTWTNEGQRQAFAVGLDMSDVTLPKEVSSQKIAFNTQQGEKVLGIERFTVSELATVLVVESAEEHGTDKQGRDYVGIPDGAINPALIEIKDDKGNILHCVSEGNIDATTEEGLCIMEFTAPASDAESISITPMLENLSPTEKATQKIDVDVSASDQRIQLTDFGGYDITSWKVDDQTVIIGMKPYGWIPAGFSPELITDSAVPMLGDEWTDPETGESGIGYHSAIQYIKSDYVTGEKMQMDSYYKATNTELEAVHNYYTYGYIPGAFIEDTAAAQSLAFK